MKWVVLLMCLGALPSCAAVGSYVSQHPELADEASIAMVALECIDDLGAAVLSGSSIPSIIGAAVSCVSGIFSADQLKPGTDLTAIVQRVYAARQRREVKRLARELETFRAAPGVTPNPYMPAGKVPTPEPDTKLGPISLAPERRIVLWEDGDHPACLEPGVER